MTVICVDGIKPGTKKFNDETLQESVFAEADFIYECEEYTVIKSMEFEGQLYYVLLEKRHDVAYSASRFMATSEIDEMERMKLIEYE